TNPSIEFNCCKARWTCWSFAHCYLDLPMGIRSRSTSSGLPTICCKSNTDRYIQPFIVWSARDGLRPNGKSQAKTRSGSSSITDSPPPAESSSWPRNRSGRSSPARLPGSCGRPGRAEMTSWRHRGRERDLDREIRADLELEAEEQGANGLSLEEA